MFESSDITRRSVYCVKLSVVLIVSCLGLFACGGGSGSTSAVTSPGSSQTVSDDPSEEQSPTSCLPDPSMWSDNSDRPVITLHGERVVTLNLGEHYVDDGATADDGEDGDISDNIEVVGVANINTDIAGDYMLRYEVSDSEGNLALSAYRLVRVIDDQPPKTTKRYFSEIDAVWEYVEHLPAWVGQDPQATYPLIITNHGWDHSKRFDSSNLMTRMDGNSMVQYLNGALVDSQLPYIILTPQRCWSDFGDPQVELLHAFVEWAKRVYPVDENRVYMTGLSMGGWATWEYIRSYPENIAAAAPIAGGGNGYDICNAASVPVWAFTARDDLTVPYTDITWTIDSLNQCDNSPVVTPKVTVFAAGGHVIDDNIYDLSYLNQGEAEFDIYDQSIFGWFLRYQK